MLHNSSLTVSSAGTQKILLRDGAEINYRVNKGSGSGRFVLIHSLAMNLEFWEPVASLLSNTGDVLLYDCRGHGQSSLEGVPFSVEQFADDLDQVLSALGWEDVIVVGASMGGCVAIAFAIAYPSKLRGLGLIDTTASYGEKAPEQWEERAQKAIDNGLLSLVAFQRTRWFSSQFAEANPDIVEAAVEVFLANDVQSYAATCRMLGRVNKTDRLGEIVAPTVILVGSDDFATPLPMAEAMRRAIPGARLIVLDGAAHLTPLERPGDVGRALLDLAEAAR